ncbi:uncharacterized protein TM35_000401780 [Trypanosoma theileri]|uniref:PH domain-containing protein n=1 Tax=Trypanosoma theileri TaxID=67003 RepID=A0A1X0NJY9_9TRYP|nr:uncharacterized protein TM35_000401780 [Trypanosoma theileri]ORC84911.1 hypothetical protein TM35_000401780 [Trypanosoma theileri]
MLGNLDYEWDDGDDSSKLVERRTPDPLPPPISVHNNYSNDNNINTQERLIHLHNIIQRSLDRAEIPNRSSDRLQLSPSAFTAFDSTLLSEGGNTYLNCMQQLLLAQFESLGRKDIMLLHSESFRAQQEEFHMGIQHLLRLLCLEGNRTFVPPSTDDFASFAVNGNTVLDERPSTTSAITATNDSINASTCLKNVYALVDMIWQESTGRQVIVLDQINEIGAILQSEAMLRNALMISRESENILNVLEHTSTFLCQTAEMVQQFLQREMEENKKVTSTVINEIDNIQANNSTGDGFEVMPKTFILTSENNEKFTGPQEDNPSCESTIDSLKEMILFDQSTKAAEENIKEPHDLCSSVVSSCDQCLHIDPSPEKYPTIAGNVYRSFAPHVLWQLRFHKFKSGVLRFSKEAPDGKHIRWWTVFNVKDILHLELEDSENCIGEAKPPLYKNDCTFFSVYFKKKSDNATRRVRFCCAKQSETLAWFFALRRSFQMAKSQS